MVRVREVKEAKVADADHDIIEQMDEDTQQSEEIGSPIHNHAVWFLSLNMGSCNGCDQQIMGMLAPRYRLKQRGITLASSPRHADIIILTGILTQQSLEPIERILLQAPDPCVIVAVGDCAINGGIFANSPTIVRDAAERLGVNVEIAGCPPSPGEIIQAIEEAAKQLDSLDEPDEDEEQSEETIEDDDTEEEI
jgi:membrane-bound hydrogenase subunit mbhJ